ncbi:hypothetical protein VP03_08060 [Sinorhizobium meliloti]|nr:hypothetical protein VP03_08060 [Sinorhizobium meliloti]
MPAVLRVERITQAVADEVQRVQRHDEEDGGKDQEPRRRLYVVRTFRDQRTPARKRGLHAQSEERQKAFEQDDLRHDDGDEDDDRTDRIRDDVPADDLPVGQTQRLRRSNELAPLKRQRLAAHDAGHIQPFDSPDHQEDQDEAAAEEDDEHHDEENEGQRIEDLYQAHHDVIDAPADIARGRPVYDADAERNETSQQADGDGDLAAQHHPDKQVAAIGIGAEGEIFPRHLALDLQGTAIVLRRDHLGVLELVCPVEIARGAGIDRLIGGHRGGEGFAVDVEFRERDACTGRHALHHVLKRRRIRARLEAGADRDIGRKDLIVAVRREKRTDE